MTPMRYLAATTIAALAFMGWAAKSQPNAYPVWRTYWFNSTSTAQPESIHDSPNLQTALRYAEAHTPADAVSMTIQYLPNGE